MIRGFKWFKKQNAMQIFSRDFRAFESKFKGRENFLADDFSPVHSRPFTFILPSQRVLHEPSLFTPTFWLTKSIKIQPAPCGTTSQLSCCLLRLSPDRGKLQWAVCIKCWDPHLWGGKWRQARVVLPSQSISTSSRGCFQMIETPTRMT